MARYDEPDRKEPQYVVRWVGQRVSWSKGDFAHRGLVIDACQARGDEGKFISLKVARDDGFIAYGVDADLCDRIPKEEHPE